MAFLHFAQGLFQQAERLVDVYTWLHQKQKKTFHLIRITKEIFNDLMIWKMFVENVNGTSFILDDTWLSNFDMQLFTDSAGGMGKGCGCYLFGKWSILQWPVEWYRTDILKDITFLEMIPIALSVFYGIVYLKERKLFFMLTT